MRSEVLRSHLPQLWRLAKYASVSAISTATSLTVLGVLVGVFSVTSVLSNFVAIAVGTVPSFELNRRWVWSRGARVSIARQVVPFCALSLAGLLISSVAVHLAGHATSSSSRLLHTGAVEMANFGSYGVLWVLQFLLCDKVLFKERALEPPLAVSPDQLGQLDPRADAEAAVDVGDVVLDGLDAHHELGCNLLVGAPRGD